MVSSLSEVPVWLQSRRHLTQGTGITVTNGAGSITIASTLGTSVDLTTEVTGTLPVGNGGTGATSLTDLIALTTHTTGNYVASLTAGNGISGTVASEGATPTLDIDLLVAADGTGVTSSNSGLEFAGASSDKLALIQGCSNGQGISWNDTTNLWECTSFSAGLSGTGTTGYNAYWSGTTSLGSEQFVATVRGGTGLDGSAAANGTLLIGNGTGYTLATLTDGTGITITEGAGSITIASTLGTSVDLTTEVTGTLPVGNGGTGATSLTDLIALTTHTTGNYVASLTAGNGISGTVASEGATPTLDIDLLVAADGTGVTSSNSGLEFAGASSDKLALIQGCSNGQGISWNDTTNLWECTSFSAGLSGSGTTGYATYWSGTSSLGSEQFLSTVRGGTGLDGSAAANGTLLIGNGTGYTLATLTGTANEIGITNAAGSITIGVPDDGLDFTEFQDTLDLDAALTLNQTTNTWTQSFTGTTTTGFAYTATSLTTGSALNVTTTNTATANTALSPVQFNLTNAQSTTANTNGVTGLAVNFTNNPSVAGNTEYALRIQNQLTANVTDNAVSALLLLDNADSTATGTTIVTDAIAITNSGGSNFTNFLNTPTLDISAAGAITGATGITSSGSITFSAFTSNGGPLYTNGSGVIAQTTAGTATQVLHGGTAPSFSAVSLTTDVSGTLPVGNGGTGATTFTANGVLYGNTTGAVQVTAAGTNGQLLLGVTAGAPTFATMSSDASITNAGVLTIAADAVALTTDTTGNYVANVQTSVLTGLTGGSAGSEGASLTLNLDYSQALTGDVALGANAGVFGQSGFAFEGSSADTIETYLVVTNPTASDKTITFPNVSGTIALLDGAQTFTSATWNATAIGAQYGGTGINTSASTGIPTISAGTWSVSATLGAASITADSLDFTEFQDTLDLDAALTLNQTTNTWTQSFTGTTTTGFAYTATSLTTGSALNVTTTNTATANTALSPVQFNLTNAQSTTANTNGVTGLAVNFTNNPSVAGNTEYALRIQNQLTANVTDNAVSALLLLDNADSTATGTTIVTDAIAITNSGGSNFTNFLNTPTLDISAAGAITGATGITSSGSITFSAFTSNGGPLYTNGSGVIAQTTAGTATQVLHGGTAPSFSAVSLTTDVSGTLPVGNGGTGATTFTANGVLYGNTTGAVQVTAAGTNGQLLLGVTAGAPTFATMSSDASITNAGVLTIAADAVALTTDTTGNYVANVANGNGIAGGSAGSEGASLTLAIDLLDVDDSTGAIASNSGLEFQGAGSNELTLLQGCSNGQGISWDDTTMEWECTSFSAGLSGSGTTGYATYWSGTSSFGSEQFLSTVRGGTGIDGSAAANGTLLIGNGTGYT